MYRAWRPGPLVQTSVEMQTSGTLRVSRQFPNLPKNSIVALDSLPIQHTGCQARVLALYLSIKSSYHPTAFPHFA